MSNPKTKCSIFRVGLKFLGWMILVSRTRRRNLLPLALANTSIKGDGGLGKKVGGIVNVLRELMTGLCSILRKDIR